MSARVADMPLPPGGERLLTHLFFSENVAAHDRASAPSVVVAVLLHLLLLFLAVGPVAHHLLKTETDPGVGTGIGAGMAGGGGGGNDEQLLVSLSAPPVSASATEAVPPPPPPPDLVLPQPDVAPPPPPQLAAAQVATATVPAVNVGALAGGGQGSGVGSGAGPGTGPGSGGGSGGGEGGGIGSGIGPGIGRGRLLQPTPDFMLMPPTAPGAVHGKTVVVRLAIDATGTVRDVELIPSTGDRGFDQALRKTALGWHFRPARDASNRPVAVNYDVSFNF